MPAFELGEEILRHLAQGVHQHIQAAAVGHADHGLLHALRTRPLQQVVEQRRERLAALAGESLLPDIARVQVAL